MSHLSNARLSYVSERIRVMLILCLLPWIVPGSLAMVVGTTRPCYLLLGLGSIVYLYMNSFSEPQVVHCFVLCVARMA